MIILKIIIKYQKSFIYISIINYKKVYLQIKTNFNH